MLSKYQIVKNNWNQIKNLSDLANVLTPYLKESPFSFIKLFVIKIFRSFYGLDSHRYENYSIIMQIVYLTVIIKGIFSSIRNFEIIYKYFIVVSLIFVYFLINAVAVVPILRYINLH